MTSDQDGHLAEHRAQPGLDDLVEPADARGGEDGAGELAHPARHHHHEGVHDVVLAQLGPHVADLGERAAGEAGQPRPEREGERVHPPRAHAEAGRHAAVLGDGADAQAGVGPEEQQVHGRHRHRGEADDEEPVVRELHADHHRDAARQPPGRDHVHVGGAEPEAQPLLDHEAHAPGQEQGLERPPVEEADDPALQREARGGRHQERQRQRDQEVVVEAPGACAANKPCITKVA